MDRLARATIVASFVLCLAAACGGATTSVPAGDGGVAGNGGSSGSSGGSGGGGGGGSTTDASAPLPPPPAEPYDACDAPTDCAWGEIPHEILSSSDCVCLFGCPYIPLSKATVDRRSAQYKALCKPNVDGQGHPCGIDDCASPPSITCVNHTCVAGSPDAGH